MKRPMKKHQMMLLETTSQWIEAGGLSTGWLHLTDEVLQDRDKAIAIKCKKWNASATSLFDALLWLPKSQIVPVEDDFYDHKIQGQNYLVPFWLMNAKSDEGFEIFLPEAS